MNMTNSKIEEIRELGLDISNCNMQCTANNDIARKVRKSILERHHGKFILGSVLAETESLQNAEFDVMFSVVENYSERLTSAEYSKLHSIAEENDTRKFISYLNENLESNEETYMDMIEEVEDFVADVHAELDDLIHSLKEGN